MSYALRLLTFIILIIFPIESVINNFRQSRICSFKSELQIDNKNVNVVSKVSKHHNEESSAIHSAIDSAIAGALSCSVTHSMLIPFDVIKTKIHTDASLSKASIVHVFKSIIRDGGIRSLLQGLSATASGYFMQGTSYLLIYMSILD